MTYIALHNTILFGDLNMQNNLVDLVNEAITINSGLLSKTVNYGVATSQLLAEQVSDQAADWLNIKNFEDYVTSQKNWNAFAIDQTQKATRTMADLGNEAYNAYMTLLQKASAPVAPAAVSKTVKSKATAA